MNLSFNNIQIMMKRFFNIILFCFIVQCVAAQSWKYDFGEGIAAKGYTKVTPQTKFTYATGFGFDKHDTVRSVKRNFNDVLRSDFITSDKPFYFSVKIPEGNYDV